MPSASGRARPRDSMPLSPALGSGAVWTAATHGTRRSPSMAPPASPQSSLIHRKAVEFMPAAQAQRVGRSGKVMTVVRAFPLSAGFPLPTYTPSPAAQETLQVPLLPYGVEAPTLQTTLARHGRSLSSHLRYPLQRC